MSVCAITCPVTKSLSRCSYLCFFRHLGRLLFLLADVGPFPTLLFLVAFFRFYFIQHGPGRWCCGRRCRSRLGLHRLGWCCSRFGRQRRRFDQRCRHFVRRPCQFNRFGRWYLDRERERFDLLRRLVRDCFLFFLARRLCRFGFNLHFKREIHYHQS